MERYRAEAVGAALAALLAVPAPGEAKVGISTQFTDVVLAGLKPGRSYNLREMKGVPYTVRNRGDGEVMVQVDVIVPRRKEIIPPYEPLPDPAWVQVRPDRYRLGPGEPGFSDVVITLPDDPNLLGKHYAFALWGRTVDTGMLAGGVESRIRFSVGRSPQSLEQEKAAKAMVDLNYDLWPTKLYVRGAKPGAPYDVKKEEKRRFILTNRDDQKELELIFDTLAWRPTFMPLPAGYEAVNDAAKWVRFEPKQVKLDPLSVAEVNMIVDVPERLRGKKVVFIVQLSLPIGVVVGATHAVLMEVPAQ
ncbi:MAG: hypothetical protein WC728_01085 [Elusimicrobiota bacterium]